MATHEGLNGKSLKKDPITGYLTQTTRYALTGFTSDKKVQFFQDYFSGPNKGNISACMISIGMSPSLFYRHMREDQQFAQDFKIVRDSHKHTLEGVMLKNAETPRGFMDRICWLRKNYPEEYGNKTTVEHKSSDSQIDSLYASAIEGEVVQEPIQIEQKENTENPES